MPTLELLQSALSRLSSADDLRRFFADLSYEPRFDDDVYLADATLADQKAQENLDGRPEIIAASDEFRIIYAKINDWSRAVGSERALIARLLPNFPFALWIFSDVESKHWHFVNVKRGGKTVTRDGKSTTRHVLRRISISTGRKPGRTVCERIEKLDIQNLDPSLFGLSGLQIQNAHDGAFDVEAVTKEFYNGYRRVVRDLQSRLKHQQNDPEWAHALALQTLNRMMFLRFIEKKEAEGQHWLGDDPEWSLSFWDTYKKTGAKDEFYVKWLRPLFFEAFNNSFAPSAYSYFPEDTLKALDDAPYLNGGLFKENNLDTQHKHTIPDSFFALLFDEFQGQRPGFFERFNFTITEDSPFDQEVAVDPEMIGHVYESLINLSELVGEESDEAVGDERGDHGIFYTQRVEIDLMCRLALGDYLFNHLSEQEDKPANLRDLVLEWVFAYEPAEKQSADSNMGELGWWPELNKLLHEVKVCDPACGSGAFLVGMLVILSDLSKRVNSQLAETERDYDRCRRIIEDCLYGVDVMDWAVHVAELRLWLQLVIENNTNPSARKRIENPEPLLPNLSFKVRPGDSLVQELGGVTLGLGDRIEFKNLIKPSELASLRAKKRRFFKAGGATNSQREIEADEKALFAGVLSAKRKIILDRLENIEKERTNPTMFAEPTAKQVKAWDTETATLRAERDKIEEAGRELEGLQRPPFVWRVSFFEAFDGKPSEAGFDIVVGNPPYVDKGKIAPPRLRQEDYGTLEWKKLKDDYKLQLQKSVQATWSDFFEGSKRKLNGQSDLYVYFFLHGLKLLAPKGSFCFITSNSWMDVGYGGDLQEFLLRYCQVRVVFDNQVKRAFKNASVNTSISLLGCGSRNTKENAKNEARFVMWRVPFETASSPILWQEIENGQTPVEREEFNLRVLSQKELLQLGTSEENSSKYEGNKWSSKFLRAPRIYDVLLDHKQKLKELSGLGEVKLGITSCDNNFFYITQETANQWKIEEKFLSPIFKSPQESRGIFVETKSLSNRVFLCNLEPSEVKNFNAAKYIAFGEKNNVDNVPCLSGRRLWYSLGSPTKTKIVLPYSYGDSFKTFVTDLPVISDKRLVQFLPHDPDQEDVLSALLNSTFWFLMLEVGGSSNMGEGALVFNTKDFRRFMLPDPALFTQQIEPVKHHLSQMKQRNILPVSTEVHQSDRRALDEIIFDAFRLTKGEREAVYESVVDLVEKRLQKASSLRGNE